MNEQFVCPVCKCEKGDFFASGKDTLHNTSSTIFNLYKCFDCRIISISPQPSKQDIQEFYPKTEYYSLNSKKQKNRFFIMRVYDALLSNILSKLYSNPNQSHLWIWRLIAAQLTQAIPLQPSSIMRQNKFIGKYLDIGCGDGSWVRKLKKYGWNVKGVDFTGSPSKDILIGDFLNIKFSDKYDYIRFSGVIEHVTEPVKFLQKIYTLLEDDGVCVISTPNSNSLSAKIFGSSWIGLEIPRHLIIFNLFNLRDVCAAASLTVIDIKYELSSGSFAHSLFNFLGIPNKYYIKFAGVLIPIFISVDYLLKLFKQSTNICITVKKC